MCNETSAVGEITIWNLEFGIRTKIYRYVYNYSKRYENLELGIHTTIYSHESNYSTTY